MILITGATGTSGRKIVKQLTQSGTRIRALVRDRLKAEKIAGPNVELAEGDMSQPGTLAGALEGIDHALLLSSPDPNQVEIQGNFIDAAKKSGVRHVVKFSAIGADANASARLLKAHGVTERQLEQSGMGFTHLRPNVFMQNFLMSAGTIASQGAIYAPIGESKISFVDVRDIAAVAARTVTEPGHEGNAYEITGPESLTHAEVAKRLSVVLGKKINFVDIPPSAFKEAMLAMGAPEWMADGLNELYAEWRKGSVSTVSPVVADIAKRDPIAFDQFARDHASAFPR